MNRKRARFVAFSVVVATVVIATLAWGAYTTTSNPADADNVPIGQSARAVVSIRNTGATSRTITGITKSNPISTSCVSSIVATTLSGAQFPITLGPNMQLQLLVQGQFTGPELSLGPPSCTFDIADMSGLPVEKFTVTFANSGGSAWELQPKTMNFGTQSGFEVQTALVLNHSLSGSAYTTAMITDPSGSFTFQSPCMGTQSCTGTTIASGGFQQLQIKCDPTMDGTRTALLGIYGGTTYGGSGALLSSTMLVCNGIGGGSGSAQIQVPMMVDITGPQGLPTMVGVPVTHITNLPWRMTSANINNDPSNAFSFVGCGAAHSCAFTAPDRALPSNLDVVCSPGASPVTATLVVQGEGGAHDFDTAALRCSTGSGGPMLIASPSPIIAGSYSVGVSSGPFPLQLTNAGSDSLSATIVPPPSGEWSVSGCVSSACTLSGAGSSTTVNVTFTPEAFGDRSSNLVITNTGMPSPVNVGLVGSGSGVTLAVTAPPPPTYTIDFGTIPKGSTPQRPLTMLATGNIPASVTVNPPTLPFSVATSSFNLNPGVPGGTAIGCSSATPGGPFTQTISFASNAYEMDTMSITARCEIADTELEVSPTPFDFGEVRVGSPAAELAFTLRNPSPTTPLVIHSMRLSSSGGGLTLDVPITTNTTLAPGEIRDARLVLDATTEIDLVGRSLLISVDVSMLSFPITGKVVRPSVRVVPEELDMGTACVDSQVVGEVLMINDGTATLAMEQPTMTNAFAALFQDPPSYPAPLPPGRTAMLGVTPSASTSGLLEGSLSWSVDAPGSPFQIPVTLEYIADGAAVSPRSVPFGVVPVETRSGRKTIKLENCGTTPVTLELGGVTSRTGGLRAWDVQPANGTIVLPPDGVQMIGVEFAPLRRGSYAATIELEIDNVAHRIEIFGDASGPILEEKSFYGCGCESSSPSRGWPLLLALLWIRRRCRSGSSSAR